MKYGNDSNNNISFKELQNILRYNDDVTFLVFILHEYKMILWFQVAVIVSKCELGQLGVPTENSLSCSWTSWTCSFCYSGQSHISCKIYQWTIDLSFNTVSRIQVRFSRKAFRRCGPMEAVTCGGNTLRFNAAVLLRLSRMGLIKTLLRSLIWLVNMDSLWNMNYLWFG